VATALLDGLNSREIPSRIGFLAEHVAGWYGWEVVEKRVWRSSQLSGKNGDVTSLISRDQLDRLPK
jgi:hypothetical protein